MKRSEMTDLISKMLRLYRLDNVEDAEAADRLLKVIEEAGMLPPKAEFSYAAGFGYFTDYAWEEE